MSVDAIITLAIGLIAAVYVGTLVRRSARKLLAPTPAGGSACGGCSGCGTDEGHADSEESCTVRDSLIVLGKKAG